MSDQPPWDQNLERQIPGLREALANLANVASNSGYRVATIVFADRQQQPGAQAPPTRIAFQPQLEQPPTLATTTQAVERWAGAHPQPPQQWHPSQTAPLPADAAQLARQLASEQRAPSVRSKRDSASALEGDSGTSAQFGKRKRFSDPPTATQGGPAGAFWGTVLEEGTRAAASAMAAPRAGLLQPPLVGPSHVPIQPAEPEGRGQPTGAIEVAAQQEEEGERVKRSSTFPGLRLRSASAQRPQPVLPSLQEAPFATTRESRDRYSSPAGVAHGLQQPERRSIRRTASQLLGRLSPFGAGASVTGTTRAVASPPPLPTEGQLYRTRTPGLPLFAAPQRRTQEAPGQQPIGDTAQSQIYQSLQRASPYDIQPQAAAAAAVATQQSGSSSGVSHAQPSRATTSPPAEGSRPQTGSSSRGKRGRRSGSGVEREQFFECELCDSKFRRKSDKNRHVRVVHEKSRPFVCPICEKTFGEKSNMLKHRASVHDDVRTFRCPYCDESFSQRGLCDTHVKTVHDKKQAKYFCEHCGLPFSRKVQLNDHYEQVHPEFMVSYGRQFVGTASSTLAIPSAPALAAATAIAPSTLAPTTTVIPTTAVALPPAVLSAASVPPGPAAPGIQPPRQEPGRGERILVGDTMYGPGGQEPGVAGLPRLGSVPPAEGTTTGGMQQLGVTLPPQVPRSQYQSSEGAEGQRSYQGDSGGG